MNLLSFVTVVWSETGPIWAPALQPAATGDFVQNDCATTFCIGAFCFCRGVTHAAPRRSMPSVFNRSITARRMYSDDVVRCFSAAQSTAVGKEAGHRIRKEWENRDRRGASSSKAPLSALSFMFIGNPERLMAHSCCCCVDARHLQVRAHVVGQHAAEIGLDQHRLYRKPWTCPPVSSCGVRLGKSRLPMGPN
jgi:hypothetical protein